MSDVSKRLRDRNTNWEEGDPIYMTLRNEAADEIDLLTDRILRFVRGECRQICSYCGWESPPPGESWEALQAHVRECPEHPVRALRAEVERLRAALDEAQWLIAIAVPNPRFVMAESDQTWRNRRAAWMADKPEILVYAKLQEPDKWIEPSLAPDQPRES